MRLLLLPLPAIALWAFLSLGGCDALFPAAPSAESVLDGPIDGLTGSQMNLHAAGDAEFARRFTSADGVGPIFVATSCAACHPGDARGHPVFNLTRFGRMVDGRFDHMEHLGGPQLQNRAVPGYVPEVVPAGVTGLTRLNAPAVTGLGLLEAVDDAAILGMADPNDADGDGVSGRVHFVDEDELIPDLVSLDAVASAGTRLRRINGQYVGRFGKKARTINLVHQTIFAYAQDMGLTTEFIPRDLTNVQAVGSSGEDGAPDPEVGSGALSNLIFYLRTLRPPPRRGAAHPDVVAGAKLFEQVRCSSCHVTTLTTGASNIAALDRKTFHPYTDLLLHDMGPALDDGYTEGNALTSEWRTAPLWGIGLAEASQGRRPYYLHDGRATTLEAAIAFHGGEASRSRAAYDTLSAEDRRRLLAFLRSL